MKHIYLTVLAVLFVPSVAFGATFNHNLTYGTTGTDVSQLQQFLADEGLYSGTVTATFGPLTQSAVISFQRQESIVPASGNFGTVTRGRANAIVDLHPEWTEPVSAIHYYTNVSGSSVRSPVAAPTAPAGATAQCKDGTYSSSLHHSGTCSGHRGVLRWL